MNRSLCIQVDQARLKTDLLTIIAKLLAAQTQYQRVHKDGTVIKYKRLPHVALHKMTGNHIAALMLERLIDLTPRAASAAGEVYKSATEWKEEMGFSRRELDIAKRDLKGLIVWESRYNKRARKTVNHYRICLAEFVRRLAKVLGLEPDITEIAPAQNVHAVAMEDVQNGHADPEAHAHNVHLLPAQNVHAVAMEDVQNGHADLHKTDIGSPSDSYITTEETQRANIDSSSGDLARVDAGARESENEKDAAAAALQINNPEVAVEAFKRNWPKKALPDVRQGIRAACAKYGTQRVLQAISESADQGGETWKYIRVKLEGGPRKEPGEHVWQHYVDDDFRSDVLESDDVPEMA